MLELKALKVSLEAHRVHIQIYNLPFENGEEGGGYIDNKKLLDLAKEIWNYLQWKKIKIASNICQAFKIESQMGSRGIYKIKAIANFVQLCFGKSVKKWV